MFRKLLTGAALLTLTQTAVRADCWRWESFAPPGATGIPITMCEWDPDGEGPLASRLVIGSLNSSVRAWDGESWEVIDPESRFFYGARLLADNGELYAAGRRIGQPGADRVYRLSGTTWTLLGDPQQFRANARIESMCSCEGRLVVAGELGFVGNEACNGVAAWSGTTWERMDAGIDAGADEFWNEPKIRNLNGTLYLVGIPLQNHCGLLRWNGASWEAVLSANVAIGFDAIDYDNQVAILASFNSPVEALKTHPTLALWDGEHRSSLAVFNASQDYFTLAMWRGQLVVGGDFLNIFDYAGPFNYIATRNSSGTWETIAGGFNGAVLAVREFHGELYAVGNFTESAGRPVPGYARLVRIPSALRADFDGDGEVALPDLAMLLSRFGSFDAPEEPVIGDTDGDRDVDLTDLAALLVEFGNYCQ